MKEYLRRFRFWLAALIFEKYLKLPCAQEIGERIEKECSEYNIKHWHSRCNHCGESDLVSKVTGSEGGGLFTYISPHHFYECKKCGNHQDNNGSRSKYTSRELKSKGIIEDSDDRYRYKIITEKISNAICASIFILFGLAVMSPFLLLASAIWFNIGPFAR